MVNEILSKKLDSIVDTVSALHRKSIISVKAADVSRTLSTVANIVRDIKTSSTNVQDECSDYSISAPMSEIEQLVVSMDKFRGRTGMKDDYKTEFLDILDRLEQTLGIKSDSK